MASCTSVVCLPSGSGRYASAYERRGDLLSVLVGSNDPSSTYQCGQAVDAQGLPATLQQQLSTLLRSGWTSLVVYVGAVGSSSGDLPQALLCTINGIYAALSTVQTYAATVHIVGDVLDDSPSSSSISRHQVRSTGVLMFACWCPTTPTHSKMHVGAHPSAGHT
jgi:hypothetical protein